MHQCEKLDFLVKLPLPKHFNSSCKLLAVRTSQRLQNDYRGEGPNTGIQRGFAEGDELETKNCCVVLQGVEEMASAGGHDKLFGSRRRAKLCS